MKSEFVVASSSVCEHFSDIEDAKEFAKRAAEETKERICIYLRCGTQVGLVDQIDGMVN